MQCAIPAAPSLAPFLLPLLLFTVFPLASRPFQPKGAREITHSHSSTRHSTSFFCIKLPLSLQPSQQWEHAMQSTARLQSVPHSRTCGQLQLRPSTRDGETRPVVLRMRSRFSNRINFFCGWTQVQNWQTSVSAVVHVMQCYVGFLCINL